MDTTAMRRLMMTSLQSTLTMPAQYQRQAYALALAADDVTLKLVLARRPDAPADLLEKYRQEKKIDVRAAYLTRPGLDPTLLAQEVASEKRAAVLATVVTSGHASADLLTLVEETFRARPTITLAEALVHRRVSPETGVVLVKLLGPRWTSLSTMTSSALVTLVDRLADHDASAQALAPVLDVPVLALALLRNSSLTSSQEAAALTNALNITALANYPIEKQTLPSVVARSLARHSDGGVHAALTSWLAGSSWGTTDRYVIEELLISSGGVLPAPAPGSAREMTLRAAVSTDATELSSLVAHLERNLADVIGRGRVYVDSVTDMRVDYAQARTTVRRLANNPALALPDALKLAPILLDDTDRHALLAHHDDEALTDAVLLTNPFTMVTASTLARYADPRAAQERLAGVALERYQAEKSNRRWGSEDKLFSALSAPGFDPEVVIDFLPWSSVQAHRVPQAAVYQIVAERLSALLGDDPVAWETFTGLAGGFDGTVGELLEVTLVFASS